MEVINIDQIAFLPLWYILNNVLLAHETIDLARHSN
jgi:hypothetical protein